MQGGVTAYLGEVGNNNHTRPHLPYMENAWDEVPNIVLLDHYQCNLLQQHGGLHLDKLSGLRHSIYDTGFNFNPHALGHTN